MKLISIVLAFLLLLEIIPLRVVNAVEQEKTIMINEEVGELIDEEISEAIIRGKADAEEDMEALYESGFLGCPFGVMTKKKIELKPEPKLEKLEGKSEKYIEEYTKAYEKRVKELQKKDATQCCVSGSLLVGGLIIIITLPLVFFWGQTVIH